jgi:hypothetical protein
MDTKISSTEEEYHLYISHTSEMKPAPLRILDRLSKIQMNSRAGTRDVYGSGSLFFIIVAARQLPKKENLKNS